MIIYLIEQRFLADPITDCTIHNSQFTHKSQPAFAPFYLSEKREAAVQEYQAAKQLGTIPALLPSDQAIPPSNPLGVIYSPRGQFY